MKKMDFKSLNKKSFFLSLVLLLAVVGVAATVALGVAQSNSVTNTFKAGKIDTEIEETTHLNESELTKKVSIKNSSSATSDAYIRVRLTKSPENEEIKLEFAKDAISDLWIYNQADGFYYYRYSVAPNESTTELLSKVDPGKYKGNFDVSVYQESCIATTENRYVGGGTDNPPLNVDVIISAFNNATTTQAPAE